IGRFTGYTCPRATPVFHLADQLSHNVQAATPWRRRLEFSSNGHARVAEMDIKTCGVDNLSQTPLAHTIVCPRSFQKTPENIGFDDCAWPMEDRDFHDSAPAIRKRRSQRRVAGAGAGPPRGGAPPPPALGSPRSLPVLRRGAPRSNP